VKIKAEQHGKVGNEPLKAVKGHTTEKGH